MEEKMNKLERKRRKRTDKPSAISTTNMKIMKIFYRLHELLFFGTHVVNVFGFCYIYEN